MQVSKKHCTEHILKSLGKERKEVLQKKKEKTENKLNLACRTQKHGKKMINKDKHKTRDDTCTKET